MIIYCCGCQKDVEARLTGGAEIYPHRFGLGDVPFWICDVCNNYVGCHHKTKERTKPLGCIPTKEIMSARKHIHALIDPMWKSGRMSRTEVYGVLSAQLGKRYHTANIRSIDEAREIYRVAKRISDTIIL